MVGRGDFTTLKWINSEEEARFSEKCIRFSGKEYQLEILVEDFNSKEDGIKEDHSKSKEYQIAVKAI